MTQVEAYRALKPITSGTAFTSGQWGEGEEPNTGVRAITRHFEAGLLPNVAMGL